MNPLTYDQVRELTGKVYAAAQKRELDRLGIPAKRRSDGSVLVLESVVNACFSVLANAKVSSTTDEPRWGALRDSDDGTGKVQARPGRAEDSGDSSVHRRRAIVPIECAKALKAAGNPSRDA